MVKDGISLGTEIKYEGFSCVCMHVLRKWDVWVCGGGGGGAAAEADTIQEKQLKQTQSWSSR